VAPPRAATELIRGQALHAALAAIDGQHGTVSEYAEGRALQKELHAVDTALFCPSASADEGGGGGAACAAAAPLPAVRLPILPQWQVLGIDLREPAKRMQSKTRPFVVHCHCMLASDPESEPGPQPARELDGGGGGGGGGGGDDDGNARRDIWLSGLSAPPPVLPSGGGGGGGGDAVAAEVPPPPLASSSSSSSSSSQQQDMAVSPPPPPPQPRRAVAGVACATLPAQEELSTRAAGGGAVVSSSHEQARQYRNLRGPATTDGAAAPVPGTAAASLCKSRVSIMVKQADDLRKDQVVLDTIELMRTILARVSC
jgi:hypothetical protein